MFGIPIYSFYLMAGVVGLLVIGSVICAYLKFKNPEKDYTELKQRINSWWVMIAIVFAVLLISKGAAITFFAFLSFLMLKEFLSIVPTRLTDRRAIFWAYVAIPVQYFWIYIEWYGMFIVFVPVAMSLILPMRMVLAGETKGFIRSTGILIWSTMLTVFCIGHAAFLLVLPVQNELAGNVGLVLFLLFMTQFNDVCQYIWGKSFGKRKIMPTVSPNKTVEGFLGGFLSITACAALIAPLLTPLNHLQGAGAGALIALGGFFGDVVISSIKRDLQIKDSGNLIPGHGGLLDRLDSLTYTAPIFFHYLYHIKY
ncbi:MAG: phosphatidate cytidylyltransferase [Acidiferrobacterales bacterium]|nr:phosphatidate cytidylyltransferase [Acidiferrobacterales bacterium]